MQMTQVASEYDKAFQYYKYRVPYSPGMCARLARQLGFDQNTALLDLACGDGSLTRAIAPHVGRITGIDSSQGMLSVAYRHEKIRYLHHDQNEIPFTEGHFDHVTVGRALNWLSLDKLSATMNAVTAPEGALVICGASFRKQGWWEELKRLMEEYGGSYENPQTAAMARLPTIGFQHQATINDGFAIKVRPSFLLNHALSYAPITQAIEADIERFKSRMEPFVRPAMQDGHVIAACISWAAIWKRSAGS
jgi:ubiquinone/menaquinone biosynthesis C-methylase UbiE